MTNITETYGPGLNQTFIVPNLVKQLTIEMGGAKGGGQPTGPGNFGGLLTATLGPVSQGQELTINVGGQGTIPAGGLNGGGDGGGPGAGGGGGRTDISMGSTLLFVSGGGGGNGIRFLSNNTQESVSGGIGGGIESAQGDGFPLDDGQKPPSTLSGGGGSFNGAAGIPGQASPASGFTLFENGQPGESDPGSRGGDGGHIADPATGLDFSAGGGGSGYGGGGGGAAGSFDTMVESFGGGSGGGGGGSFAAELPTISQVERMLGGNTESPDGFVRITYCTQPLLQQICARRQARATLCCKR